jgi:hypothetical protein
MIASLNAAELSYFTAGAQVGAAVLLALLIQTAFLSSSNEVLSEKTRRTLFLITAVLRLCALLASIAAVWESLLVLARDEASGRSDGVVGVGVGVALALLLLLILADVVIRLSFDEARRRGSRNE